MLSRDVLDNIVPFIRGEEAKTRAETRKILGSVLVRSEGLAVVQKSDIRFSAMCTRVPVLYGHTAWVSIRFRSRQVPCIEDVKAALATYTCEAQMIACPLRQRGQPWEEIEG